MKSLMHCIRRHPDLWLALGVTLLAAALRLPWLARHPPGFYHDEAVNGMDSLRILAGERPVFFPRSGGREAGYMYFVALSVAALGRSPAAVRLVSALMGIATVPATYLLGRALYERRLGALAATIIAIMVVPIHLSRMGFRVVSVPFTLSWFLWALVRAYQTGRGWRWLAAGLLYGLTFHTYTATRVTPLALLAMGVFVLLTRERRRLWPGAVWFGLGAALTVAPLAIYALNHPADYFTRTAQTVARGGWVSQIANTAGMFFVRGDLYPRHNVPGRPFFDPLLGVAFLLGLIVLWRDEKRTRSVFVAVWLAVTSLTTLLSVDPPHFLRTTPMLPMLALPPALGLAWAWDWIEAHSSRQLAALATVGVLALSLILSATAYFSPRYRLAEDTTYQMDVPAVEMALTINEFLGVGWQGEGWRADPTLTRPERRVLMPKSLWDFSETTRYLVPLQPDDDGPLSLLGGPEDVPSRVGDGLLLLVVPGEQGDYAAALPEGGLISARWGPMARADLETGEAPFVVYVAYQVVPWEGERPAPVAEFEAGMALLDYEVEVVDDTAVVHLVWLAQEAIDADYTLFVHVLGDGQMVGQMDGPMGEGLYPTSWWRPGDLILEERAIPLERGVDPATVTLDVGFYLPEDGTRLPLVGGGDVLSLTPD